MSQKGFQRVKVMEKAAGGRLSVSTNCGRTGQRRRGRV